VSAGVTHAASLLSLLVLHPPPSNGAAKHFESRCAECGLALNPLALLEQMFDTLRFVIDQRRFAQREPRSLQPEQLGDLSVTSSVTPHKVRAWVVWEDGVEELVDGVAAAWTKRAVQVRFGIPGHMHEVWVWAGAVERV
jgi:hypothetical protein